jgi:hypothetical protein
MVVGRLFPSSLYVLEVLCGEKGEAPEDRQSKTAPISLIITTPPIGELACKTTLQVDYLEENVVTQSPAHGCHLYVFLYLEITAQLLICPI